MKNLFIFVLLFVLCKISYAQTGALTATNTTSCDYTITMHANSPSMNFPTGCADIVAIPFTVPGGGTTTFSWTDPYDFETGTSYDPGCSPSCTPIGWATIPSPYTVCGTSCGGGGGGWLGTYPSDWFWTYATVDFTLPCTCGITGTIGQITCAGTMSINATCGGRTNYATWSYGSTTPYDVNITIY